MVLTRLRTDPATRAYADRRRGQRQSVRGAGGSSREHEVRYTGPRLPGGASEHTVGHVGFVVDRATHGRPGENNRIA